MVGNATNQHKTFKMLIKCHSCNKDLDVFMYLVPNYTWRSSLLSLLVDLEYYNTHSQIFCKRHRTVYHSIASFMQLHVFIRRLYNLQFINIGAERKQMEEPHHYISCNNKKKTKCQVLSFKITKKPSMHFPQHRHVMDNYSHS